MIHNLLIYLSAGPAEGYSTGILVNGDVVIDGGATVNAASGPALVSSLGIAANVVVIDGAVVNAVSGPAIVSNGILLRGNMSIKNATVTAAGHTSAFSKRYVVPVGFTYYLNTAIDPSDEKLTSDGSAAIETSHKYAKIMMPAQTPGDGDGGNTGGGDDGGSNTLIVAVAAAAVIGVLAYFFLLKKP